MQLSTWSPLICHDLDILQLGDLTLCSLNVFITVEGLMCIQCSIIVEDDMYKFVNL